MLRDFQFLLVQLCLHNILITVSTEGTLSILSDAMGYGFLLCWVEFLVTYFATDEVHNSRVLGVPETLGLVVETRVPRLCHRLKSQQSLLTIGTLDGSPQALGKEILVQAFDFGYTCLESRTQRFQYHWETPVAIDNLERLEDFFSRFMGFAHWLRTIAENVNGIVSSFHWFPAPQSSEESQFDKELVQSSPIAQTCTDVASMIH